MTALRLALSLVALVVAASLGVGAVSPSTAAALGSPFNATSSSGNASNAPMGANVSMFMQANAAQTGGSVDNGMWVAAFAHATANDRKGLVSSRLDALDATLTGLRAERDALQSAYRNGSINRSTYLAGMASLVGRLAAVGDGVDEADHRGQSVGVNRTRLDELRAEASDLSGGEVSRLARNLTDDHEPPGEAGVFEEDHHGQAANGSDHGTNTTEHGGGHEASGSSNQAGSSGSESDGTDTATATATATETATSTETATGTDGGDS